VDDPEGQMNPIEYFVINVPETLNKDPRRLMKELEKSESIELFENLAV
jgi:hypothetical protein